PPHRTAAGGRPQRFVARRCTWQRSPCSCRGCVSRCGLAGPSSWPPACSPTTPCADTRSRHLRDMARGRLIAFEGGEASGKSTQAARLAADLDAVLTREPGGTDVGRRIRDIVLDPALGALTPRAEALLLAADRAQHVAELVEPVLARGDDVVTDRYIPSSLAYQGYGRGLDVDELRRLS